MSIETKNVATLREVARWWEDQADKKGPYSHDYCRKQASHYNRLADLSKT